MSNLKLNPEPPIGFNKKKFGNIKLIEEDNFSIVSVSLSNDRLPAFKKFVLDNFKTNIPEVGKSKFTKNKNMRIIGLQPGQFFILFERNSHHPVNEIKNMFGNDLFYSDQSDSWSVITIDPFVAAEKARNGLPTKFRRILLPISRISSRRAEIYASSMT